MLTATQPNTTPTRRTALGFSAAAIVVGLTTPTIAAIASRKPSAHDPDADLLALCAKATRCEARIRHIDQHGVPEEDCDQACDAWNVAFDRLAITPATTFAGLAAKADALRLAPIRERMWSGEVKNVVDAAKIEVNDMGQRDGWLARSLCDDILAMGSAAA
jgi:hypothetical protein